MVKQKSITSDSMKPSMSVILNGFQISSEASLKQDLMATLLSLGAHDDVELENSLEAEYDVDDNEILKKIDAYQAAQILTNIISKISNSFVKRATSHALKTKGLFENEMLMMADQAFLAGVLNLLFYYALTKNKLAPPEAVTKTRADMVKAFFIGAGISWIGMITRYELKKAEKDEEQIQNSQMSNPADPTAEEEFAEPGKTNINKAAAKATEQNISQANNLKEVKTDNETQISGDLMSSNLEEERRQELLSFRDFFTYINNYLITDSPLKTVSTMLIKNLLNTNFKDLLESASENYFEEVYQLDSLISGRKSKKKNKSGATEAPIVESVAYEFLALLTLIAREMTSMYTIRRGQETVQRLENEQMEEQMLQAQQNPYGEDEESDALEAEKARLDVEQQAEKLEQEKTKTEREKEKTKKAKKKKATSSDKTSKSD